MKYLLVLLLTTTFLYFDCNAKSSNQTAANSAAVANSANMSQIETSPKLEYKIEFKSITKDAIEISYTVKNNSDKFYLIYNRGDSNKGYQEGLVYVEPQADGTIELSQRSFKAPAGKKCPNYETAITAGASWLKPGETVSETVRVSLPLKAFTPFDECVPKSEIPANAARVKFCLGVSEVDPKTASVNEKGYVENWQGVGEQKLLCSGEAQIR